MDEITNRDLLEGALARAFTDLEHAKVGSDEYKSIKATIKDLYQLKNEAEKIDVEADKVELEKQEKEFKANLEQDKFEYQKESETEKAKHQIIAEYISSGAKAFGAIGSVVLSGSAIKALLDIEKTGVPTSKVWQWALKPLIKI